MSTSPSVTLSLRVPNEIKARLEKASARTHRSRAYLTIAALKLYLNDVEREEKKAVEPLSKYEFAKSFAGVGAEILGRAKSAEEIDAMIREHRGDE